MYRQLSERWNYTFQSIRFSTKKWCLGMTRSRNCSRTINETGDDGSIHKERFREKLGDRTRFDNLRRLCIRELLEDRLFNLQIRAAQDQGRTCQVNNSTPAAR